MKKLALLGVAIMLSLSPVADADWQTIADGNWNTGTTWENTDGAWAEADHPTAGDGVATLSLFHTVTVDGPSASDAGGMLTTVNGSPETQHPGLIFDSADDVLQLGSMEMRFNTAGTDTITMSAGELNLGGDSTLDRAAITQTGGAINVTGILNYRRNQVWTMTGGSVTVSGEMGLGRNQTLSIGPAFTGVSFGGLTTQTWSLIANFKYIADASGVTPITITGDNTVTLSTANLEVDLTNYVGTADLTLISGFGTLVGTFIPAGTVITPPRAATRRIGRSSITPPASCCIT